MGKELTCLVFVVCAADGSCQGQVCVQYSTSQPQGQPRTVEKGARRREEEMHPLLIQQSGKIAGQIITLCLAQSGKISGHLIGHR